MELPRKCVVAKLVVYCKVFSSQPILTKVESYWQQNDVINRFLQDFLGEQGMREGMLWFDNSEQRELDAKIERAAQYYQSKYGARPTLCFVHPTMLLNAPSTIEGIEIRATNSVLPNHFWLGAADNSKASAA